MVQSCWQGNIQMSNRSNRNSATMNGSHLHIVPTTSPLSNSSHNGDHNEKLEHENMGGQEHAHEEIETSRSLSNDNNINKSLSTQTRVSSIQAIREKIGFVIETNQFEFIILFLIIVNSIMMGLQTFPFVHGNDNVNYAFNRVDSIILIIFTVELVLRFIHLGLWRFVKDAWVMFDFFLVAVSWWSIEDNGLKALRAFRILRLMHKIEKSRIIIKAIVAVLPKLASVAALLLLIMFIFAIYFTQTYKTLYADGLTEVDYFSNLDMTFLTLYQLMTFDGWDEVVRDVMQTQPWSWIPFILYIILTGIAVTNIVVAVICESIIDLNKNDKKKKEEEEEEEEMCQEKKTFQEIERQAKDLKTQIKVIKHRMDTKKSHGTELIPSPSSMSLDTRPSLISESDHLIVETQESEFFGSNEQTIRDRARKAAFSRVNSITTSRPKGILAEPRFKVGLFLNNKWTQICITALIIINSIFMALATMDFVFYNEKLSQVFDSIDTAFLCVYTLESALQLFYLGFYLFRDGWALFDLSLVIVCWVFSSAQVARSLRIIRILRIIPKLKSLQMIVRSVIKVLPKLGGISLVLFLFFYVFAIIFTVLFQDLSMEPNYFSRLDTTFFTLFQIMTMSEWADISRELQQYYIWAPILVCLFLVITGFIFLNLIVALICEAMVELEVLNRKAEDNIEGGIPDEEEDIGEESKGLNYLKLRNYLQEIAERQNEIESLLNTCTIIPNEDDENVASIIMNHPCVPQSQSPSREDTFFDAQSDKNLSP